MFAASSAGLAVTLAVHARTGDVTSSLLVAALGLVACAATRGWDRRGSDTVTLEREVNQAHAWHADAEAVFLNSATPTLVLDQELDRVLRVNDRAGQLLGRDPSDLDGAQVHTALGESTASLVAAVREPGPSVTVETATGPREFDVLAERTGHGEDWRWIVQLVDLTDERRMQRVLRSERDAIDRVVGRLAHDLRAPIATVVNMAELLISDRASTRRTQSQLAGRIALNAREILDVADDLMDDAQSGGIRSGTVSLTTVVGRCLSVFEDSLEAETCTVSVEVDDVGDVAVSPALVRTVVLNLVDNAIRHRHPARPLELVIRAHVEAGHLVLAVSDNGVGVPEDARSTIFEHEPDRRPDAGLGLSGCRELARSHGGDLEVSPQTPFGSTFTLTAPLAALEEPSEPAPQVFDAADLDELALRRRLDEASDFGVAVLDENGETVYRSGVGLGPLGFDPATDDVRLIERVHVDDLPAVLLARSTAIEHPDTPQRVVCRAQHRDGSWLEVELVLSFDPDIGAGSMVVTWRLLADAVSVSESLFDHVPIALLAGGAGARLIRANGAARTLFGWKDEIPADSWLEIVPDERTRRAIHEAASGGHSGTFEWDFGDLVLRGQVAPVGSDIGAWLLLVSDVSGTVLARREILRLARLVESSHDAVIATDLDGRITAWNPAAEDLFGWTQSEMLGQTLQRTIPEEPQGHDQRDAQRIRRNGTTFWASVSDAPVLEDGEPIGIVHTVVDTTELHTLAESQKITLEALSDGVAVTDRNGDVSLANPAMHELIGVPADSLVGSALPEAVFGAEPLSQWRDLIVDYRHPLTGEERFYRIAHDVLPDDAHLFVLHDATERQMRESELVHRTLHDPLTGLPNRVLLLDRLTSALARESRTNQRTAVLYIDLDRFKPVNDEHGHAAGDHVLREVATRLAEVCRSSDTVGRLGGDEFVMVCDSIASPDDVALICTRIQSSLAAGVELADGTHVVVGASVGVAMTHGDEPVDPDNLLIAADRALYDAKASGPSSVCTAPHLEVVRPDEPATANQ